MDYINNNGEKIGSLDTAVSNDKNVTINRLNDVTTVTVRDRNTARSHRKRLNGAWHFFIPRYATPIQPISARGHLDER
jgi:hypothetical protein